MSPCYRCGFDPCLFEESIAAGRLAECSVVPRPWTLAEWAWNVLYDATVEQGDSRLISRAVVALRGSYA